MIDLDEIGVSGLRPLFFAVLNKLLADSYVIISKVCNT